MKTLLFLTCLASSALLTSCGREPPSSQSPPSPSVDSTSIAAKATASEATPATSAKRPAPVREGGAIVRAANEEALYIAHEDLGVVRRVPLPVDINTPAIAVKMPGPPAAVLALHDRVLVTVRGLGAGEPGSAPEGPGLLLIMRPDKVAGLVEVARVELPADAWGIAVTPDERTAIVTSAWTHKVSAVDIASAKKLWSVDVAREPRGVVVLPDGKTVYVTHLVRATLTRIDGIDGEPTARDVPFPAAPLRAIAERSEAATLGYSAVLSPDGSRLFVPRQALGALGSEAWNGQSTVDILLTGDDKPLAENRRRWFIMLAGSFMKAFSDSSVSTKDPHLSGPGPIQKFPPFIQPRAVVYRKTTKTLLVASEGTDHLVELDALSIDPSTHALRYYFVGGPRDGTKAGETHCGAPGGVALSADESTAFVFCRSSHDLSIVRLDAYSAKEPFQQAAIPSLPLADDPLPESAALGRRLFYNATDGAMSGGYACAGCHPEGRDDGHVWHEDMREGDDKATAFRMHAFETQFGLADDFMKGVPRQTPMLAGRVSAFGPYGWKGESPTLRHRIMVGFGIHSWWGSEIGSGSAIPRAEALVEFLRKGLTPPAREDRELTAEEQRGRALFEDPNVGCATCHAPKTEYTNRAVVGLGEWIVTKARFEKEALDDWRFKTPSLLYVGGTPPYYHDGSSSTLEELIDRNGNRMGHTKHLSKEDRGALIAFLRTL